MSALAAVISAAPTERASTAEDRARAMLGAMSAFGTAVEVRAAGPPAGASIGCALGTSAHAWEHELHGSSTSFAARGPLLCAVDASLYHRDDLRRALGGARGGTRGGARGPLTTDAELTLAAYETWGAEGFAKLEGDFACIIWDAGARRLVAARDFAGHRALHFARAGEALLIATSVGGLLADEAVPRDLDLTAIATSAAGLWAHAPRTAYRAIEELPAGHLLHWAPESGVKVTPFWRAPESILHSRQPIGAAAEELRALLVDAVRERLAPGGPTGLSLSGGWDSTAVGGAATIALRGDAARRLAPVSISYPEGDPGREDELIRDVVAHWGMETSWLPVDGIPLLVDAEADARVRELPFAHTYEQWNRALSRRARSLGARVMFDGVGGDQLFQVSDVYLSELFTRGRWIALAQQLRQRPHVTLRSVWRGARRPQHHLLREAPFWFTARFLRTHDPVGHDVAAMPALPSSSSVLAETHAFLRFPFFARIVSTLRRFAMEEGVELRSPLLDDRVVHWAVRRPWSERADGRETKIVLRRAMAGLVPDHVLAPRTHRTGVTSAYFLRQLRGPARPVIEAALQDPLLASLGMIDAPRLRHAWSYVLQHDDDEIGARLFFTVQSELWLRARAGLLSTLGA